MAIDSDLLKKFSEAHGISGHEDEVRNLVAQELEGCGEFSSDGSGSLFCTNGDSGPRVMLAAHMDEIGFLVQNITANGFLQLVGIGGWWPHTLLSQRVLVKTRSGRSVQGVIGSKPPHFLPEGQRNSVMSMEALFVDVGAESAEQVKNEFGIHLGDPVVPDAAFSPLENPFRVMGKAFDNRMGCACIIHTLRALQAVKDDLAVEVVGAFASQEEVGMRGATVTSAQVQPDLAIVFEGSPADDFYYSPEKSQGGMHKGVQIRCMDKSYITNPAFLEYAHELGDTMGITYQDAVRRGGSTNAGKISLAGKAVPTLVLGIPSRYVHSHYNFCAIEDVESTVRMAVEVIKGLNEERIKHLMHQDIM